MTTIWILDRASYLNEQLADSTWIERLLVHGPTPDTAYGVVVECIERAEYIGRACALIKAARGSVRLVQLSAALPPPPPPPPSAFAGTLRPTNDEPLLKASNNSPWCTTLLRHLFFKTPPEHHLVLHGPPGCGKSLALERARALAVSKSVPHMFLSAAADTKDLEAMFDAQQFLANAGASADAVFVIDDVEAFASTARAKQFFELIKAVRTRCVLVCNDSYDSRVRHLRKSDARGKDRTYSFCEATPVDDVALDAHLQRCYPTLPAQRRQAVVGDARGDVRAAQLAAEMELCSVRRMRELALELAATTDLKQRVTLLTRLAELAQRTSATPAVDDQQHSSLTSDILLCVRATPSKNTVARSRAPAVVRQCTALLRPRAVDAATTMQSNYARLCDADELELMASMADDLSTAYAYKQSVVDGMMADKFGRNAPDETMSENFKEQLLFDTAVVLPCVRASRAAVGRGALRALKLEFPEYALHRKMGQVGKACRELDYRHEVLVRTTMALAGDGSLPTTALEQQAWQRVSMSLTTVLQYRDFASEFSVRSTTTTTADEDNDDDNDSGSIEIAYASMDRLERTLFVFPLLLVQATGMSSEARRDATVERCTQFGFDADMYAHSACFYKWHTDEREARTSFAAAKPLVLHENHAATAGECVQADGTSTVVPVSGVPTAKRKIAAPVKTAAAKKKSKAVAPTAPTLMDRFVQAVKRSKGGDV